MVAAFATWQFSCHLPARRLQEFTKAFLVHGPGAALDWRDSRTPTRQIKANQLEGNLEMGHIFTPPLDALVEFCAHDLGIKMFVETGTFRGESAAWAAERFREVITIEQKPELYAKARETSVHSNVVFHCGRSADILPQIAALPTPKLYWLDAHWCGAHGDSAGIDDQCPIAKEVMALHACSADDVIIIDDFHMFAAPPPEPFRHEHWPSLDELFSISRGLPQQKMFVVGNALVLAGGHNTQSLRDFLRSHPPGHDGPEKTAAFK